MTLLLGFLYLVVPSATLAAMVAVSVYLPVDPGFRSYRGGPDVVLLFTGVAAVLFPMAGYQSRHRPSDWPLAGLLVGMNVWVFGGLLGVQAGLSLLSSLILAGLVGAVCWAVSLVVTRLATTQLVPELADSPYELVFRVRGSRRLGLYVDRRHLTLRDITWRRVPPYARLRYRLSDVVEVTDTAISADEPLVLPEEMGGTLASQPGPAVYLRTPDDTWVLPIDRAPEVAAIVERRAATARRRS